MGVMVTLFFKIESINITPMKERVATADRLDKYREGIALNNQATSNVLDERHPLTWMAEDDEFAEQIDNTATYFDEQAEEVHQQAVGKPGGWVSDTFDEIEVKLATPNENAARMEVEDTFIITGGHDFDVPNWAFNSVVRYNSQGESEVLPSLTVRRFSHACASYLNGDGKRIILVTGGANTETWPMDSTELMVDLKPWRPAANLPSPRSGLRAASLDNKVFLFGGRKGRSYLDSILSYEPDTDTWQEAGTMTVPRYQHAVAVFPDVSQLCP